VWTDSGGRSHDESQEQQGMDAGVTTSRLAVVNYTRPKPASGRAGTGPTAKLADRARTSLISLSSPRSRTASASDFFFSRS
jgi:hypothetical protein